MCREKNISVRVVSAVCGLFLLVFFMMLLKARTDNRLIAEASTKCETIRIGEEAYKGQYTGSMNMGIPSGKGKFVSEDESFVCDGVWENGKLEGKVILTYADGTTEYGNFHDGNADGFFRSMKENKPIQDRFFYNGMQCGCFCLYQNGEMKEQQLLINGISVPQLKEEAICMTKELYEESAFFNQVVYITGEVLFSGQDEDNCYCRIKTNEAGTVYFSYSNSKGVGPDQALLPNMSVGDQVKIYGFLMPEKRDMVRNDADGYGFFFLSFLPLYGELIQDYPNREEHSRYPFLSYGMTADGNYEVQKCLKIGEKQYVLCKAIEKAEDEDVFILEMNESITNNKLYLEGDVLKIQGYYNGQYKKQERSDELIVRDILVEENKKFKDLLVNDYSLYPSIQVIDVE